MSEDSTQKKSKAFLLAVVLIILALAAVLFFVVQNKQEGLPPAEAVTTETLEDVAEDIEETAEANTALSDNEVDIATLTKKPEAANVDIQAALKARVLGNPDAPVKISEHSSFSCGHCAKFHSDSFKQLKANWLDTGKAYLVFSDFPLNAPALHASLVGRCISDDDQYFAYVEEVFAKQREWAFQADHVEPLKKIAANYGIDGETFASCMNNQELQTGLLNKVRAAQQQFGVNSTPSFIVNNTILIAGEASYDAFNSALKKAIEQSKNPTPEANEESP